MTGPMPADEACGPSESLIVVEDQARVAKQFLIFSPGVDGHNGREQGRRGREDDNCPPGSKQGLRGPQCGGGVAEVVEGSREDDRVKGVRSEGRLSEVPLDEMSAVPRTTKHLSG